MNKCDAEKLDGMNARNERTWAFPAAKNDLHYCNTFTINDILSIEKGDITHK